MKIKDKNSFHPHFFTFYLAPRTNISNSLKMSSNLPVISKTQLGQLFNENQIKVLEAFFSTYIAELDDNETRELISVNTRGNENVSLSSIISFAKYDLSSSPEFLEYFLTKITNLSEDKISRIRKLLGLLSSRPSAYLLTGYF